MFGGRNDWEIVSYKRKTDNKGVGWVMKVRRKMKTQDKKLDYQIEESGISYISFEEHDTSSNYKDVSTNDGSLVATKYNQEYKLDLRL